MLWALPDDGGAVIDFETGNADPAMDRVLGASIEQSFGRRVQELAFVSQEAFRRTREGAETGTPAVVATVVEPSFDTIPRSACVFVHPAIPAPGGGTTVRFSLPSVVARMPDPVLSTSP